MTISNFRVGKAGILMFFALTIGLALSAIALPPLYLNKLDTEHLWVVHLTLELLSIFVSVSIVAILFQRLDGATSRFTNMLVFGFTAIALIDYIHALSYKGMPLLVSESSPEKSIFFWLVGRIVELLIMTALACHFRFSGRKSFWLLAAISLTAVVSYAGLYHLALFPATFDPGTGVTPFKTNIEYGLFLANIVLAFIFWRRYRGNGRSQELYFAGSSYCMACCALTLTNYVTPSDFSLLIGHLFKIGSAVFIYAAIYWTELKRPYQLAKIADARTRKKDAELQTIVANIPLGIMRFNSSLQYVFINPFMHQLSGFFQQSPVGQHISETLPKDLTEFFSEKLRLAFGGDMVRFQFEYTYPDEKTVHRDVIIVPEPNEQAVIETVLCLVVDTTEKEQAELVKMAALRETEELRKALDEHAIVAFTDAKGIITAVNNKFCDISKYSREELLGRSHRLINSGHHPQAFFKNMWQTISKGNIWHGEICNKTKDGSLYWVNTTIVPFLNSAGKPEQYIAIRADITERKMAEQEAKRLAYYDELTNLPNRRLLKEKLEKLFNEPATDAALFHALLLIDLDNFKDINDSLGHSAGDELLKQVALRLQHQIGATQTAARLGGDEFVVLMAGLSSSRQHASELAADQAEQIRARLSGTFVVDDHSITVTPSIGLTLFDSSGRDASEFLKQADIAMYQSKEHGKNQVSFFDPELQSMLNKRSEMLRELTLAIAKNELRLHYQPIFNQAKAVIGVEALVRWQSELLGMVSPNQFIPMAEQSNLILAIGNWVLHTACRQLQLWSQDAGRCEWTIAVNVSARQLQQPNFVKTVTTALQNYNARPALLKLEITESMLQADVEDTINAMKQLRQLGVHFSLDDFGTGYSSLSYLTKLPIDTLKIDRSFVNNMMNSAEDFSVVSTILSLASSLKLEVVAEGVETTEQLHFLIDAGCHCFQGYLLGKPVPVEQLPGSF